MQPSPDDLARTARRLVTDLQPESVLDASSEPGALAEKLRDLDVDATGLEVHDGYGQTETGALTGMPIGPPVRPGSMGKPLPGFRLWIEDGELCAGTCSFPGGDKAARDHLWLTAEEWKTLIANDHVGETRRLPDRLVYRLARFHLVDNTRGEPPAKRTGRSRLPNHSTFCWSAASKRAR